MFAHAAQALGYRVCVLEPTPDCPVGQVTDEHIVAAYDDVAALDRLASLCKVVTTEFENVPATALSHLAATCFVAPAASAVAIAQDRIEEKRFIGGLDIPVVPHAVVRNEGDARTLAPDLFPAILKTARLGYDGKGQLTVAAQADVNAAWQRLGRVPCVLERRLSLRQELSCIVCRDIEGATTTFPVAENSHSDGILATSIVPARCDDELAATAQRHAARIAAALDYVGVLCVEFFVLDDGTLLVNEIAPRPHNSGHWSIDACATSQFEQQARVLAGLPLGAIEQLVPAVMLNLLGDLWRRNGGLQEPRWADVLRVDGAKLHLYGKNEARPGRKMGHVTVLGRTLEQALARAARVARVLGLDRPQ